MPQRRYRHAKGDRMHNQRELVRNSCGHGASAGPPARRGGRGWKRLATPASLNGNAAFSCSGAERAFPRDGALEPPYSGSPSYPPVAIRMRNMTCLNAATETTHDALRSARGDGWS